MSEHQDAKSPAPASADAQPSAAPIAAAPTQEKAAATRRTDYLGGDVLKHARKAFAETIALKVKQLREYVPKKKALTNPDLTGAFIEELVRGFIRQWIGQQRLVHGTFYSEECEGCEEPSMQIDGIIHDERRGPAIISEGDFEIVHPAFCAGVIEIKTTITNIKEFEGRLQTIYARYMHHLTRPNVMGVVIADADPQKTSECPTKLGGSMPFYNYSVAGLCPIFVLFKEREGEYEPHFEAIDALIRATHQLVVTTNYL